VNLSKLSVLIDQLSSSLLNFFDVVLDFVRVVPRDNTIRCATFAFRVLNNVLKLLSLFKHHGHLALNNLSAHRVVEISNLLESDTFLVELLSVLGHSEDLSRNVEAVFS